MSLVTTTYESVCVDLLMMVDEPSHIGFLVYSATVKTGVVLGGVRASFLSLLMPPIYSHLASFPGLHCFFHLPFALIHRSGKVVKIRAGLPLHVMLGMQN